MDSLNEISMDFKVFEEEVFRLVCKMGVEIIRTVLTNLDQEIAKERNKEQYRHKGLKKNTIKTIMGPVEYKRAIYENIGEEGQKSYVFLLDKMLNMKTIGKMSGTLVEKALENVSIASYRKSARNVTNLTGQSISQGAIWNLVQEFGKKLENEENERIEKFKKSELNGEREVEVLFMESDGLWLSMQGKDRPKGERSGKREIKLGVHYEGWVLRSGSGKKKTYLVKNKGVVAGYTDPDKFKLLRDSNIAQTYNYDEIKYKILNGDGAVWIRKDHDAEGDIFQLDRFHVAKLIMRNIKDKDEARKVWGMYKKCQFKSLMERLTELKFECGGVCEEIKKIEAIESYLNSNKDGIIPYRQKVNLPEPPLGMSYRNLGTMEHNVFDVLGYRMKGQKMSWSISGANKLAKILAIKTSGKLYDKISSLLNSTLSERAIRVYESVIENVKANTKESIKKVKLYPIHESSRPFTGVSLTEGRKSIRKMFENKALTDLIYR